MKILIDLPVRSAGRPDQRTGERKTTREEVRTYRARRTVVLRKSLAAKTVGGVGKLDMKVRQDGGQSPTGGEVVLEDRCTNCGREVGDPDRTETKIVEDIPDPGSVEAVEYEIGHYECECGEEIIATHEDIPEKGNFGPNVLTQTTLLKFQERVPYGKIQSLFEDVYDLHVSTNTLYSFTGRVADQLRPSTKKSGKR